MGSVRGHLRTAGWDATDGFPGLALDPHPNPVCVQVAVDVAGGGIRRTNGTYVLVDFGAVSELLLRRAGASTVVGTMGYMAPEQFQGRAMAGTDVYAVGATALAALTGTEPETLPHKGLRIDVASALQGRVSPALVASLARMVEPDPDHRARSLAEALDGAHPAPLPAPHVPAPPPAAALTAPDAVLTAPDAAGREDEAVKSIRKLLWLLWGLGWIIVPVLAGSLHLQRAIPGVMFVSLALLFIVTWHKGAGIRLALRALTGKVAGFAPPRPEVHAGPQEQRGPRVDAGPRHQVRVHAGEVSPEELAGETEQQTRGAPARRQARRL